MNLLKIYSLFKHGEFPASYVSLPKGILRSIQRIRRFACLSKNMLVVLVVCLSLNLCWNQMESNVTSAAFVRIAFDVCPDNPDMNEMPRRKMPRRNPSLKMGIGTRKVYVGSVLDHKIMKTKSGQCRTPNQFLPNLLVVFCYGKCLFSIASVLITGHATTRKSLKTITPPRIFWTMGTHNLHFLGVITHICVAWNHHFSWFWGPRDVIFTNPRPPNHPKTTKFFVVQLNPLPNHAKQKKRNSWFKVTVTFLLALFGGHLLNHPKKGHQQNCQAGHLFHSFSRNMVGRQGGQLLKWANLKELKIETRKPTPGWWLTPWNICAS